MLSLVSIKMYLYWLNMMLHIGRATKMLHLKCMKSRIGRFQPLPLSSQSLVTLKLLHTFFTNKTTKDITTVSILFTAAGSITNISMQLWFLEQTQRIRINTRYLSFKHEQLFNYLHESSCEIQSETIMSKAFLKRCNFLKRLQWSDPVSAAPNE